MKIAFTKVKAQELPFEVTAENYTFSGKLSLVKRGLAKIESNLQLHFLTQCDRCAAEMKIEEASPFTCLVSEGSFDGFEESFDVIESFDGFVDLDEIAQSEINLLKSDYNYCKTCQIEGE